MCEVRKRGWEQSYPERWFRCINEACFKTGQLGRDPFCDTARSKRYQRTVGTSYKYPQIRRVISAPWRARRIYDLISGKTKLTMDDSTSIQRDVFSMPLSRLAKEIVRQSSATPATLEMLRNWDGRMTADSSGALIANQIYRCVIGEIRGKFKPANTLQIRRMVDRTIPKFKDHWLPDKYASFADLFRACDQKSVSFFENDKRFGKDGSSWKWGKLRTANFSHPLTGAPLIGGRFKASFENVDGSNHTPNVGSGVSMRHVSKPANWDDTRFVIPLGQSGDPGSPNWKDQFTAWRTGSPA